MPSRVWLLPAVLLAFVLPARARADTVALVNGQALSRREFGLALVRSLGPSAIETYLDWTLIEQEAERRGIRVTEEDLAARHELDVHLRMQAVIDNARLSPQEFSESARRRGWEPAALRDELARTISPNALRARHLAERILEPGLDLSEAALRRRYEWTRGARRCAAHIVVSTQRQAEELLRVLQERPEFWTEAVIRYSLDRPGVAHNGRIRPVPVTSRLGRALAEVPEGGLTLFEEAGQWHVVRALGMVSAAAEPFEDVADLLQAEAVVLQSDGAYERLLADLHARAVIILNLSADPARPAPLGTDAAAFVNGRAVARDDFAEVLVQEYGRSMLEPYLERTLIFQEAERRGLSVPDEVYRTRLDRIAEQLQANQAAQGGGDGDALERRLLRSGLTPEEFRAELVNRLVDPADVRATLLAEMMVDGEAAVSEAEILAAHRELHGERIVVKELTAENAIRAEQMYRKLAMGIEPDLVARTEMVGPGLWMEGAPEVVVRPEHPYWPHAQGLGRGEVSGIFKEGGRYRIIQLLDRTSPAEAPPLESVRSSLERELRLRKARARSRALLIKLKAEAEIRVTLD